MSKNQLFNPIKKYNNFNKEWLFYENEKLEIEDINEETLKDFKKVDLPHDWSIYNDFNQNSLSRNEGGLLDGGIAWYVKSFDLNDELANKNISIRFGAIYMDSFIYVNGTLVGNYPFGYNTFSYDLTDYLRYGKNTIAVKVVNRQPSSRWYSGSGIYRNVDIVLTEKIHIKENSLIIQTPKIQENRADTKIKLLLNNVSDFDEKIKYKIDIYFKEKIVKSIEKTEDIFANNEKIIETEFSFDNIKLWDIENPNLYYAHIQIFLDEKLIDEEFEQYGYRYFDWTSNDGFSLNGKYVKIHGVCLHHDNGALGAELYPQADRRKLEIMKSMGVNAIRTSHNPQSREFIKLCDELGLLVQEEAFDTWHGNRKKDYDYNRFFNKLATHPQADENETWAEFDIKQMVRRDINSPSIFMWSIGNEIAETEHSYGLQQAKNLVKWIKEVDETRYVTIGENKFSWSRDLEAFNAKIADELDIVGLNYAESNSDYLHENKPEWKLYGAETSSAVKSRGVYYQPEKLDSVATGNADKVNRAYQMSDYGNDRVGWGRTAADSWIFDRDRKYYAGQFIWTGFDYIGEPTPWHNEENLGAPVTSSFFGIVDSAGLPKSDFYLYQSQWLNNEKEKVLKILPHWNFEDLDLLKKQGTDLKRDDNIVPVRVYSNIKEIELFLNGKSLGKKTFNTKMTEYGREYLEGNSERELFLEWLVPFEKGELVAVGYDEKGEVSKTDKVVTSEEANNINLTLEENIHNLDDLAYIRFDICDKNGNIVPTADNLVEFFCSENAEIIGVDNGNAASKERYKADKNGKWFRRSFSGSGIVILKLHEIGEVSLKATSEGLKSDEINFSVENRVEKFEEEFENKLGSKIKTLSEKEIIEIDDVNISISKGQDIVLPEKVRVTTENRFKKFEKVNWDIDKIKNIKEIGKYDIHGEIEGLSVEGQIRVNDFIAVENFSGAFIKGSKNIYLPQNANIYHSSGEARVKPIQNWYNSENGEIFDAEKIDVDNVKLIGKITDSKFEPIMNIRFVGEDDNSIVYSENYARAWNGSEIPAGIASYTNKKHNSTDSTKLLNNEIASFDKTFLDRWTNISDDFREKDWAGILFGRAGELTKFNLNKIEVFFAFEDDDISMPSEYFLEFYNKDQITLPKNYENIAELEHEMAKDENWTRITSINEKIGEHEFVRVFEFGDIQTFAIRVNMIAQENRSLGISEIKAFGKVVKEHDNFEVDIIADDNVQKYSEEKSVYYIGRDVKNVELKATNNAAITRIDGISEEDDINFIVKSEDKSKEIKIIVRREDV